MTSPRQCCETFSFVRRTFNRPCRPGNLETINEVYLTPSSSDTLRIRGRARDGPPGPGQGRAGGGPGPASPVGDYSAFGPRTTAIKRISNYIFSRLTEQSITQFLRKMAKKDGQSTAWTTDGRLMGN